MGWGGGGWLLASCQLGSRSSSGLRHTQQLAARLLGGAADAHATLCRSGGATSAVWSSPAMQCNLLGRDPDYFN